MRVNVLRTGGIVVAAASALLIAAVSPAVGGAATSSSGSAYGADANVSLLPSPLAPKGITVNTGRMASSDITGKNSATAVDAPLQGLVTAKVITSSAKQAAPAADVTSKAALVQAKLPVLTALAGTTPTASVISSQCHATLGGVTGSANLADLNLGKIGKFSAPSPNQTVEVPGVLKVIGNEQIHNSDGSLTVNALHIKLLGGQAAALGSGDIILASSTCAKAAPPAAKAPGQVSIVPVGAPQTGDGSLATAIKE